MNQQEYDQLSRIHRRVYGFSALVGVAYDALEYKSTQEDLETAHIELVLKNLSYDLANECEKLEKLLEAAQAQFQAEAQAERVHQDKQWLAERNANLPHGAVEAFNAVNAAYGIKTKGGVA